MGHWQRVVEVTCRIARRSVSMHPTGPGRFGQSQWKKKICKNPEETLNDCGINYYVSAKSSFRIATGTFVAWCLFNASMTFFGAVGSPWYKSPVYVGAGLVFAAVVCGFAWHARRHGKEALSSSARAFTVWMILTPLFLRGGSVDGLCRLGVEVLPGCAGLNESLRENLPIPCGRWRISVC